MSPFLISSRESVRGPRSGRLSIEPNYLLQADRVGLPLEGLYEAPTLSGVVIRVTAMRPCNALIVTLLSTGVRYAAGAVYGLRRATWRARPALRSFFIRVILTVSCG